MVVQIPAEFLEKFKTIVEQLANQDLFTHPQDDQSEVIYVDWFDENSGQLTIEIQLTARA